MTKGFPAYIYYHEFPTKIRELLYPEKYIVPEKESYEMNHDVAEYSEKNTNANLMEINMAGILNKSRGDRLRDSQTILQQEGVYPLSPVLRIFSILLTPFL